MNLGILTLNCPIQHWLVMEGHNEINLSTFCTPKTINVSFVIPTYFWSSTKTDNGIQNVVYHGNNNDEFIIHPTRHKGSQLIYHPIQMIECDILIPTIYTLLV